jgi:hypothetical protein
VWYRREGDVGWNALRRNITDSILVWDTATVPNGTYFIKIVASDAPSNPTATALSGELESIAFEIDNTPPQIIVGGARLEGNRTLVVFDVKDVHSPILRVECSQDGQLWRAALQLMGSRTRNLSTTKWRLTGRWGHVGSRSGQPMP